MALTCGWPAGTHQEDGCCGAPVTTAYLVRVHNVPLIDPDSEAHEAVLLVCAKHTPGRPPFPGPRVMADP
jgi:hypothetical protein